MIRDDYSRMRFPVFRQLGSQTRPVFLIASMRNLTIDQSAVCGLDLSYRVPIVEGGDRNLTRKVVGVSDTDTAMRFLRSSN